MSQFLASAAGEKLAVMTMDYLRGEAASGRREDFEHYLKAVPDVVASEKELAEGGSSIA